MQTKNINRKAESQKKKKKKNWTEVRNEYMYLTQTDTFRNC